MADSRFTLPFPRGRSYRAVANAFISDGSASGGALGVSLAEDLSPSQSPALAGFRLASRRQPAPIPAFAPLGRGLAATLEQVLPQAVPLAKAPAPQLRGERTPEAQPPAPPLDQAELATVGAQKPQAPRASGEPVRLVEAGWETVPSRSAAIPTLERPSATPPAGGAERETLGASNQLPAGQEEAMVLRIPPSGEGSFFAETAEVAQPSQPPSTAPVLGQEEATILGIPPSGEGSTLVETAKVAQPPATPSTAPVLGQEEEPPGPETGASQMPPRQEQAVFASRVPATPAPHTPESQTVSTRLMRTQVVRQVLEKLERLSLGKGVSEVELRLKPAWLGRVHIRLRLDSELLKVHMHTQTREAREILRASLPQLEFALRQQDIQVVDIAISQGTGTGAFGLTPDGAPGYFRPGQDSIWPSPLLELPAEPEETQPRGTTARSGEHIIDCWI